MKPILRLLGFLTLFSLAQVASAQITFTFTATADATGEGYTSGDPYTFTFTLGNFTNLSGSYPSWSRENKTRYQEETTDDDQLWASVGGSGLGGSFVRPTEDPEDPFSFIQTEIPLNNVDLYNNAIGLQAGTDGNGTQTVGLTTLSGTSLYRIAAYLEDAALPDWPMDQGDPTETTPYDYFSAYIGKTYTAGDTDGNYRQVGLYGEDTYFTFTITSLTIGGAVPEPSTYAALFGVAALGVAVWRRRKRAA